MEIKAKTMSVVITYFTHSAGKYIGGNRYKKTSIDLGGKSSHSVRNSVKKINCNGMLNS